MKKTIKIVAVTVAIWGVTGVGVAQASPSSHSASDQHVVAVRAMDTGWGP